MRIKTRGNAVIWMLAAVLIFTGVFAASSVFAAAPVFAAEEENSVTQIDEQIAENGPTVTVSTFTTKKEEPDLVAHASIIFCPETGQVLYGDGIDKKMDPLSITKVMTVYCVMKEIEAGRMNLEDIVTITKADTKVPESKLWLEEGEKITVKSLIYASMLYSGNDAAAALGTAVSGNAVDFAKHMTKEAKKLGCTNTQFKNANGLIVDGHYSTCRDIALIARATFAYDFVQKVCQTKKYKIPPTNKYDDDIEMELTNPFFSEMDGVKKPYVKYGIVAGKTGTWDTFNSALLEMAEYKGKHLITVVLLDGLLERYPDSVELIEYGRSILNAQAAGEKKGVGVAGEKPSEKGYPKGIAESKLAKAFTSWVGKEAEKSSADIHSATYTDKGITVRWIPTEGAEMYKVFRDSGKGYKEIGTVEDPKTLKFTDKKVKKNMIYRYYVRGCSKDGGLLWW